MYSTSNTILEHVISLWLLSHQSQQIRIKLHMILVPFSCVACRRTERKNGSSAKDKKKSTHSHIQVNQIKLRASYELLAVFTYSNIVSAPVCGFCIESNAHTMCVCVFGFSFDILFFYFHSLLKAQLYCMWNINMLLQKLLKTRDKCR